MVDAVDVVGESRWLVGRKGAEHPRTMQGGGKESHIKSHIITAREAQAINLHRRAGQSRVYINNYFLVPADDINALNSSPLWTILVSTI